ncbi:GatB/YqeY domain-containing protein [Kiloniella sp. b19]|uniref:GatB/YqeY domain-containing protein n=1 Tax=Kiloniella sp. GXU_MW_B19 TaxID=3141326 RepID=UPI0031CF8532
MLRSTLNDALKTAMREKDQQRLSTVRLILAALKDRDIAARGEGQDQLGEDAILEMLQKMVRQRRDSIELYEKAGRTELADREKAEVAVIEAFLPQQMDEEATKAAVIEVIAEVEAASIKDMGKVMAVLKDRYAGQMDFGKASGVVKAELV